MAPRKQHLNCPHCTASWKLPLVAGGGYDRKVLTQVSETAANHVEREHGDYEVGARLRAFAKSPAPGAGKPNRLN